MLTNGQSQQRRLLHIFPSFAVGGQQVRLASLVRALGTEFRHHIVSLDGDLSARALFDVGANVDFARLALEKTSFLSLTNLSRLRRLFNVQPADLLCTYNWGSIEAAIANRLGPKTPHVHFEDGFGPDEVQATVRVRRSAARRLVFRRGAVVVPSKALETIARDRWKLPHVRRIANGVDLTAFEQDRREEVESVVVGALGALRPEKNYARLIKCFQVAAESHNARLEIHGGGPEYESLRALAAGDQRISLPGPTDTPARAYAGFDVFALSSDTEQAPLSLMEAMATGLPVAATAVGDVPDMVADANAPFLAAPGDDGAFTRVLSQLIADPSLRARLGEANRTKARRDFDLQAMAAAHRALYDSMMAAHD